MQIWSRISKILGIIVLALLLIVPIAQYFSQAENRASTLIEPVEARTCRVMNMKLCRVYSKTAIEEMVIAEIEANAREYGALDWQCIIREFEAQADNATVVYHRPVGEDGNAYVRFSLDRSRNILAAILSFAPGGSNGVFTAITKVTAEGEVAVIRRGGEPEWLKLG